MGSRWRRVTHALFLSLSVSLARAQTTALAFDGSAAGSIGVPSQFQPGAFETMRATQVIKKMTRLWRVRRFLAHARASRDGGEVRNAMQVIKKMVRLRRARRYSDGAGALLGAVDGAAAAGRTADTPHVEEHALDIFQLCTCSIRNTVGKMACGEPDAPSDYPASRSDAMEMDDWGSSPDVAPEFAMFTFDDHPDEAEP